MNNINIYLKKFINLLKPVFNNLILLIQVESALNFDKFSKKCLFIVPDFNNINTWLQLTYID